LLSPRLLESGFDLRAVNLRDKFTATPARPDTFKVKRNHRSWPNPFELLAVAI